MFTHHSREKHGIRWWLHWGNQSRNCLGVEFYWLSVRFGFSVGCDDEGWNLSVQIPPFAVYVNLEWSRLWRPMKECVATWDNNRVFTLVDRRECVFYISDWQVSFSPWGRWGEWNTSDPWWVRGVSFDIRDVVLGRSRYTTRTIGDEASVEIPLPEGRYPAVATLTESTWKRPRWFTQRRTYIDVKIPKGIPYAGKGENSWDCDDDGLFGYSSEGPLLGRAIARGAEIVLEYRQRYGKPSQQSIDEALR